jgi:hypothetical protein
VLSDYYKLLTRVVVNYLFKIYLYSLVESLENMEKNMIRVYYGGASAQNSSTMDYVGGKITELDNKIDDNIKFLDLSALLERKLNLEEECNQSCRVSGKDLTTGFVNFYSYAFICIIYMFFCNDLSTHEF